METLSALWLGKPAWMWLAFLGIVLSLLVLDLGLLNKKQREIGVAQSLKLSAFYIAAGVAFGGWVWYYLGAAAGMNFYTGFVIEKSLSLDNIFVISLIFSFLAIPREFQHRVLLWGILGVIVLRALMIGAGTSLVAQYHWLLYVFGVFLVFTGIKMLFAKEEATDLNGNPVLRLLRRHLRITPQLHGQHFFVRQPAAGSDGKPVWWVTPLFLALVMVETIDLVFAIDSVPAILAITTDPFIVYTSNIFAILGLRALYFALAAVLHRFHYLKYALALILVFIGSKIFLAEWLFDGKVPALVSLGITFGLLGGGIAVSIYKTRTAPPLIQSP
ncbi:TerC family protein [Chitinimonas sp.]|uniref:TerC family protein n=1 Tax=Chitinimonas sp. TaxID=1934313 RepID=UPI0035B45F22